MGYFLGARENDRAGLTYQIADSRGPWFLGASRLHISLSGLQLARAMLKLLRVRLSTASCLAHVNITGRGSTIRKIVLVTFARTIGVRYLLHVHDFDYAEEYRQRGPLLKALIRSIFRGARKVLVLGARDQELLSKLLELPRHQISVLHNAVPDPLPDIAKQRPPGEPSHLLFLGHLSERKGVPELLRALAKPELASRNWRVTFAGGGPIDKYRAMARELGIADRLDFHGWVGQSEVRAMFADADALVLPSHAEGLAMAVLEGLSYGLAVVTTPVGAHSEVIEPDVSGILVPPGDVAALSDALLRVIDHKDLRDRLRVGARRRYLEKFDVRGYAERLSQLHASLLSDRRTVGADGREQMRDAGAGRQRSRSGVVSPHAE
jgi:glycosyltransferase involved in cell wall biosynthesis